MDLAGKFDMFDRPSLKASHNFPKNPGNPGNPQPSLRGLRPRYTAATFHSCPCLNRDLTMWPVWSWIYMNISPVCLVMAQPPLVTLVPTLRAREGQNAVDATHNHVCKFQEER